MTDTPVPAAKSSKPSDMRRASARAARTRGQPDQAAHIVATCNYDIDVVAVIQNGCVMGTQFHPEKSQVLGVKLLANFLKWAP